MNVFVLVNATGPFELHIEEMFITKEAAEEKKKSLDMAEYEAQRGIYLGMESFEKWAEQNSTFHVLEYSVTK